jgi:hypothetical protein
MHHDTGSSCQLCYMTIAQTLCLKRRSSHFHDFVAAVQVTAIAAKTRLKLSKHKRPVLSPILSNPSSRQTLWCSSKLIQIRESTSNCKIVSAADKVSETQPFAVSRLAASTGMIEGRLLRGTSSSLCICFKIPLYCEAPHRDTTPPATLERSRPSS